MKPKAVVLLSGGLDSAVTLSIALDKGYDCYCLVFDYGQRHTKEIDAAERIAGHAKCYFKVVKIALPWKGSSLTDKKLHIPLDRSMGRIREEGIPSTYVPGRNTIFLSLAASFAEAINARRIFIGAHSEDSSGYPDCRKGYLEIFRKVVRLGTKAGIENRLDLEFPLINKTKSGIIKLGKTLGAPLELTWSCYKGASKPCMRCDSCLLRAKGFRETGSKDPALTASQNKR